MTHLLITEILFCHNLPPGTDQNRVFVLHIHRIEETDENLLVMDERGNITFATIDLALTLGYTLKQLLKLNLSQLLPPPINAMHERYLVVGYLVPFSRMPV